MAERAEDQEEQAPESPEREDHGSDVPSAAPAEEAPEDGTPTDAAPGRAPVPARPPRSAEERAAERAERRRARAAARRSYRAKQRERPRTATPAPPQAAVAPRSTGRRRERQGVVVSDKADKTITVRIDVTRQHRVYKKTIRESSTLHAHDERNEAQAGDIVRVIESRPLSRTKRWRLVGVLERAR